MREAVVVQALSTSRSTVRDRCARRNAGLRVRRGFRTPARSANRSCFGKGGRRLPRCPRSRDTVVRLDPAPERGGARGYDSGHGEALRLPRRHAADILDVYDIAIGTSGEGQQRHGPPGRHRARDHDVHEGSRRSSGARACGDLARERLSSTTRLHRDLYAGRAVAAGVDHRGSQLGDLGGPDGSRSRSDGRVDAGRSRLAGRVVRLAQRGSEFRQMRRLRRGRAISVAGGNGGPSPPAETGESVTVPPETGALTMPVRIEPAVYVSASRSGSAKYRATFTDADPPPTVGVCAGITRHAPGAITPSRLPSDRHPVGRR